MSQPHSEPTPWLRRDRTPAPAQGWLTTAQRVQLETDLANLPILAELLERHYEDLLAHGSRNPDDPWISYPPSFTALDLADQRLKAEITHDPIGEADLARRIGARRRGVLPTVEAWVRIADNEMTDLDIEHRPPEDPDRRVWVGHRVEAPQAARPGVSVAGEASWLVRHLDWIVGQQWIIELAGELRQIVNDLEHLVGPARVIVDHRSAGTIAELAEWTGVPTSTIYRWTTGKLTRAGWDDRGCSLWFRREVEAIKAGGLDNGRKVVHSHL